MVQTKRKIQNKQNPGHKNYCKKSHKNKQKHSKQHANLWYATCNCPAVLTSELLSLLNTQNCQVLNDCKIRVYLTKMRVQSMVRKKKVYI